MWIQKINNDSSFVIAKIHTFYLKLFVHNKFLKIYNIYKNNIILYLDLLEMLVMYV